MDKPTFIGGYGTAIISFEWERYVSPPESLHPPIIPVAAFRGEICPNGMEIGSGKITPFGSVFVGN